MKTTGFLSFAEFWPYYLSEHSIAHAFHHNALLVVSNGDQARYGSITSKWEHFVEWKRNTETDKARLDAEALLDGMLTKGKLLDLVGVTHTMNTRWEPKEQG